MNRMSCIVKRTVSLVVKEASSPSSFFLSILFFFDSYFVTFTRALHTQTHTHTYPKTGTTHLVFSLYGKKNSARGPGHGFLSRLVHLFFRQRKTFFFLRMFCCSFSPSWFFILIDLNTSNGISFYFLIDLSMELANTLGRTLYPERHGRPDVEPHPSDVRILLKNICACV